jgi:hypothetical protein
VKVGQELLRHANSRINLDLYAQAGMPASAEQGGENGPGNRESGSLTGPYWTLTGIVPSFQLLCERPLP